MKEIKLIFSKPFLLKDIDECPNGSGIYFHYFKNNGGKNRIIYVGESRSFKSRQQEHLFYYNNNKYLLFGLENDNLNVKYIPDYDSPKDLGKNFDIIKKEVISNINVICGEIEDKSICNLKELEGAIIIHLYRNSETRKFLMNTRVNYGLRDTMIILDGIDANLYGLPDIIKTPVLI